MWTRDGRALFYRSGRNLARVAIDFASRLSMGRRDTLAREAVHDDHRSSYVHAMYDVSLDGRRFVSAESGADAPVAGLAAVPGLQHHPPP